MNKYRINVDGTFYEVGIELISQDEASAPRPVSNPPAPAAAPAPKPAPAPKAAPAPAPAAAGGAKIVCPMAGNILDVKARDGQKVKAGEVLFILEAMKMENEITAPAAGTVSGVAVKKGDAVATEQLLCMLR